jgi:hypothetical protein
MGLAGAEHCDSSRNEPDTAKALFYNAFRLVESSLLSSFQVLNPITTKRIALDRITVVINRRVMSREYRGRGGYGDGRGGSRHGK